MHFQNPVPNWPNALLKMPDYSLLKSVNDPALLLDGLDKWVSAGRVSNRLYLDFRHHDFIYPDWDHVGGWSFEDFKEMWRTNFFRFIDGTYLERYAPHIKLIEELNEYTDSRMITDKALLAPRIKSARAAVSVWNNEFRGREVFAPDGGMGNIPADARLVVCNSPVGNDIPIEFFRLCRDEDAVMGVRTYTKWVDGQRVQGDFRWHSGRPFHNEAVYGIKVDYVLGECGPYDGSTTGGWRNSSCMGGDRALLVDGMRSWVKDLRTTEAYAEGRILGPGAWFTSKNPGSDDPWKHYLLFESELVPLAEMCSQEWNATAPEPPQPPDPPQPPTNGDVPYVVIAHLGPQNLTLEEHQKIVRTAHPNKESVVQSADDVARLVAPGQPGSKVYVWETSRWTDDIDAWLRAHGVSNIEHLFF